MNRGILFILGLSSAAWLQGHAMQTPAQPALPAQWDCGPPQWESEPQLLENQAVGTLFTECTVTGSKRPSLRELYRHWSSELKTQHPVSAEKPALTRFEITEARPDEGHGRLTIHREATLTHDPSARNVAFNSVSKQILGQGESAFLRHVETQMSFEQKPDGTIRFVYRDTLSIERPWFAPNGIFLAEVKRQSLERFTSDRPKLLERIQIQTKIE